MGAIAIQIPQITGEQDIEVEVKINGEKKSYNYRVEVFYWSDCDNPSDDRVDCIRQILPNTTRTGSFTKLACLLTNWCPSPSERSADNLIPHPYSF